jgi:hypothetical protein
MDHFPANLRVLQDEIEELTAQFISINFVSLGHLLDRRTVRPLVSTLVRGFLAEGILPDNRLDFKCS